jgi:hypothetical protein
MISVSTPYKHSNFNHKYYGEFRESEVNFLSLCITDIAEGQFTEIMSLSELTCQRGGEMENTVFHLIKNKAPKSKKGTLTFMCMTAPFT